MKLQALAASESSECTLEKVLDADDKCELSDLSDSVLEEVCTSRGFELVKEGDPSFDHAHYVEAARQCLELEAEMNKMLEENPELLEEFEKEQAAAAAAAAAAKNDGNGDTGGEGDPVGEVKEGDASKAPEDASGVLGSEDEGVMDLDDADANADATANANADATANTNADADADADAAAAGDAIADNDAEAPGKGAGDSAGNDEKVGAEGKRESVEGSSEGKGEVPLTRVVDKFLFPTTASNNCGLF